MSTLFQNLLHAPASVHFQTEIYFFYFHFSFSIIKHLKMLSSGQHVKKILIGSLELNPSTNWPIDIAIIFSVLSIHECMYAIKLLQMVKYTHLSLLSKGVSRKLKLKKKLLFWKLCPPIKLV